MSDGPDIGADVAGGDGGDDQLRHADGEAAKAGRDQRRAARAAGADDAERLGLPAQPFGEGFRHRRHRLAAIRAEHRRAAARVVERDLLRRDIGAERLAGGRNVDEPRAQSAGDDEVLDEAQLLALGVERADDEHGGRAAASRGRGLATGTRLFEARHADGGCARGGLDAGDRNGLRPAGRQDRVRDIDAGRRLGGGRGRRRRGASRRLRLERLLLGVAADAEQPLLQFAVAGEPRALDDAVDAAVDHDGDLLGHRRRDADVLLDDEHGDVALLAEPDQHLLDLRDDDRRQTLRRLVHDEQPRVGQQRAGDREHLLLAARKLRAAVVAPLGEAREGLIDALDRPGPAPQAGGHAQMLVDGQRTPQPPPLRDIADAEPRDPRRGGVGDVLARQTHGPARRRHEAHDRLAQRRLAHAVAADDRQHARSQGQIDALQGVGAAIVDIEAAHFEHRRAHAGLSHGRLRDKAPAPRGRTRSPAACLP